MTTTTTSSAIDWRALPKGKYLMPVVEPVEPYRTIGWSLYFRSVPKILKNGRRQGRDAFIHRIKLAPGVSRDILSERPELAEWEDDVAVFLDDPTYYRAQYGRRSARLGSEVKAGVVPAASTRSRR